MPDWGDILSLPLPERMERLRDPGTRRFMQERAASPDAGVFARLTGWATYVIGDTFSAENEGLSGRRWRTSQPSAATPTLSTRSSTSCWPTSSEPSCGPVPPTTIPSRGNCAARHGTTHR
ncbi:MAG: hypothetical protein R2789_11390 [Microthrixaceae bacterium]